MRLLHALVLCGLITFGGCAARDDADGHRTAVGAGKQAGALAGHWEGSWKSEQTGHHGRLFCDFQPLEARRSEARFHAYWGILNGRYSVIFQTRRVGREVRFQGEKDLGGLFGGVYRYEGAAKGDQFLARYRSKDDHGTFELRRTR